MGTAVPFLADRDYNNVYFLLVDASGHSDIVRNNSYDKVNKLFDLLEKNVQDAVDDARALHSCRYGSFWGWQGDGGLCVIYDADSETAAVRTAIDAGIDILTQRLSRMRSNVKSLGIKGAVSVRLALHKGAFRYKGRNRHGSIHSKDLNFAAHLEKVAPRSAFVISDDVLLACDASTARRFARLDFPFEGRTIHYYNRQPNTVPWSWISAVPIQASFRTNVMHERPSEQTKSRMIATAATEVLDLGTALNTSSRYLVTTQRPAYYRDEVMRLLERGVNYTCLILDPGSKQARAYSAFRGEALVPKIRESIGRLKAFAGQARGKKGRFTVLAYSDLPYFASISIDRRDSGLHVVSPYLPNSSRLQISRADTPHFTVAESQSPEIFRQVNACIDYYLRISKKKRLV